MKELLKSVHICQSYRKNKSGPVFSDSQCSVRKLHQPWMSDGFLADSIDTIQIWIDKKKEQLPSSQNYGVLVKNTSTCLISLTKALNLSK